MAEPKRPVRGCPFVIKGGDADAVVKCLVCPSRRFRWCAAGSGLGAVRARRRESADVLAGGRIPVRGWRGCRIELWLGVGRPRWRPALLHDARSKAPSVIIRGLRRAGSPDRAGRGPR